MPRGLALGMPRICHWFHKYAKGSDTHFVSELSDYQIACNCAVRLQGCVQSCNGTVSKNLFRWLDCVQSCSAFGFWGFVEMGLTMEEKIMFIQ